VALRGCSIHPLDQVLTGIVPHRCHAVVDTTMDMVLGLVVHVEVVDMYQGAVQCTFHRRQKVVSTMARLFAKAVATLESTCKESLAVVELG